MSESKTIADSSAPILPWDVFPCKGDSFAGYTLGEIIGRGSFGTVFRVQPDPDVEWFEAVKILHRSSDVDKRRFHDEINRLKEIRLPGIARIHTTGEESGYLYYCMDYVEGQTIDEYVIAEGTQNLFPLFMELCETVTTLHEQNFIHLDIKPQNVMVTVDGEVRLLDFGISSRLGEAGENGDKGLGAGTYEFSSSEQIAGESPDPTMDVYALSCLLYTLLSSAHPKIPFDKIKREKPWGSFIPDRAIAREEIIQLCLGDDVSAITKWNPLVSFRVDSVLQKGLAGKNDRYNSVKDFKESLQKAGVLLPSFIIAYECSEKDIHTVSAAAEELELEFQSQIQVIPVNREDTGLEYDVLVCEKGLDEKNVILNEEMQESELAIVLRKRIYDYLETEDQEAWEESPYKSLKSYTEHEAHLFYGRDRETGELCRQIDNIPEEEALITVLAPSGAGKSSFLQAGVIPYFKRSSSEKWNTVFLTPGLDGVDALAQEVRRFSNETGQRLLIIDQFEDALGNEHLPVLAEAVKAAVEAQDIKVILSLRNDFYKEYISFIESCSLPGNFYNLPQPDEASIAKMIRMPALKAHLKFDKDPASGRGLDEILRDDAMLNPESLAALSFTLDEVFNKSPRGHMSFEVYQKLGGMHGAMAMRAEAVFLDLNLRSPNLVFHQVFHQLIKVDENRVPRRLYAEYDSLTKDSECKKLTDGFVEAKLFQVTRDVSSDKRIVTVSHEALIQQKTAGWKRVMSWLNRQQNNLQVRKRLAASVNDWEEQDRQSRYLYSGYGRLKEILQLKKSGWAFTDKENEFIGRSFNLVLRNGLLILISFAALLWISYSLWKESNNVDLLTKQRDLIQQEVAREKEEVKRQKEEALFQSKQVSLLKEEVQKQLKNLDELREMEDASERRRLLMDDQLRLSNIASLQQSGILPPVSALTQLSEIKPESRNWMWGRLLFNSLPNYQMMFGHKEEILSIEFSHDEESKYIVTSSWDNEVILWDGRDGRLLNKLKYNNKGEKLDFEDARFSYNGYIAAANNDNHLYIWSIDDALKGKPGTAWKMPHDRIRRIFFSKDNKYMILCDSAGTFSVWDWENMNLTKPLAAEEHSEDKTDRLYSAVLSPDGRSVVTAGWDHTIKRWSWDGKDLGQWKVVGRHAQEIWWGRFSPDGSYYVSAGKDRVAKLWDAKTFKLIREFGTFDQKDQHRGDVMSAVFTPDSKILATSSRDKKIRFWNVETGEFISSMHPHDNYIYCLDFSSKGDRLVSCSADKLSNLYYVDRINSQSFSRVNELRHSNSVESFDIMGSSMVTAAADGEIRLWSLSKGEMKSHGTHLFSAAATPVKSLFLTESRIISADLDGAIIIWSVDSSNWKKDKIIRNDASGQLRELVISKSKKYMSASFANGTIKVWSTDKFELLFKTTGDPFCSNNPVVDFLHSENLLVCGDDNGKVHIFDWRENKVIRQWQPHSRKIFKVFSYGEASKERVISCSRDGKVIMSDLAGDTLQDISHGVRGDAAYASISLDGRFLATSSTRDSNVFVWDLRDDLELLPLTGHEEPINHVEFVGDDLIVSASRDGNVNLWYSLSWKKLKDKLSDEDKKKSDLEQLQIAVWKYLNGVD